MLFFALFCISAYAFKGQWCNGCDEPQPVSKVPVGRRIFFALSGLQACGTILPQDSWTKDMLQYSSTTGIPYQAANATRLSGPDDIGLATFNCKSPLFWAGAVWILGPYELKCPLNYWLIVIYGIGYTFWLETPTRIPAKGVSNSLVCAYKQDTIPQKILPWEGDCLDVLSDRGDPVVLIAWATKDDIYIGQEVPAYSFDFTAKGEGLPLDKPPQTITVYDQTALYVYKSKVVGTRWTFCYTSKQKFNTVFKVAPIYEW